MSGSTENRLKELVDDFHETEKRYEIEMKNIVGAINEIGKKISKEIVTALEIQSDIKNHYSIEGVRATDNKGDPLYLSQQEHHNAIRGTKKDLHEQAKHLCRQANDSLDEIDEINNELSQKMNNLENIQEEIEHIVNRLSLTQASRIPGNIENNVKEITQMNVSDLEMFQKISESVKYITAWLEHVKKYYDGNKKYYSLFFSPTQEKIAKERFEKYYSKYRTNNINGNKNNTYKLLGLEDVQKMSEKEKMDFLLPYHSVLYGTFKMRRTGEDAYKYLYDLSPDAMINTIYLSNLRKLKPNFRKNYAKRNGDLQVMFIPAIQKDQLQNKEMYQKRNSPIYTVETIKKYNGLSGDSKKEIVDLLEQYQKQIELYRYDLDEILKFDHFRAGLYQRDENKDFIEDLLQKSHKRVKKQVKILEKISTEAKEGDEKMQEIMKTFPIEYLYSPDDEKRLSMGKCPRRYCDYAISHNKIKKKIPNYNERIQEKFGKQNFKRIEENADEFPLMKDFLITKNLEPYSENMDDKQLLLSSTDVTLSTEVVFHYFTLISISTIWRNKAALKYLTKNEVNNLRWDPYLNMGIIQCSSNSDLLFPMRYVYPDTNNMRYNVFNRKKDLTFLGVLAIPFIDDRKEVKEGKKIKHISEMFYFYLYGVFDRKRNMSSISIYNLRANSILVGYFFEFVRVIYIEMFVLQKINKMQMYLFIPDENDKKMAEKNKKDFPKLVKYLYRTFFFSRFEPQKLKRKLMNTKYEYILKKLRPVRLIFPERGGFFRIMRSNVSNVLQVRGKIRNSDYRTEQLIPKPIEENKKQKGGENLKKKTKKYDL
jgi:hypothetical protein